ncbi:MAG: DUF2799 domain-containing protein [Pseudomonadota bacterium]
MRSQKNEPRTFRVASALLALALVGGCAGPSVSEQQCLAGDWESIGYRDGERGVSTSRLLEHQDACGKFGVVPDKAEYFRGWEAGIETFCTPQNGFRQGRGGKAVNTLCDAYPDFSAGHADGALLYDAGRRADDAERRLQSAEQEIEALGEEIETVKQQQLDATLDDEARLALGDRLEDLVEERVELRAELEPLARELERAERELAALEAEFLP